MELPLLICKEFSCNQEKHPYVNSVTGSLDSATADVHKARWSALFSQMETALTEEEKQLVSHFEEPFSLHLGIFFSHLEGLRNIIDVNACFLYLIASLC